MWFTKSIEEVLKEMIVDPSQDLSDEEAKIQFKQTTHLQMLDLGDWIIAISLGLVSLLFN